MMRSLCLTALLGLMSLGLLAVMPSDAQAWWRRRVVVVAPAPVAAPVVTYSAPPLVTYYPAPAPVVVPAVSYYAPAPAAVTTVPARVYRPARTVYVAPAPVTVIRVR